MVVFIASWWLGVCIYFCSVCYHIWFWEKPSLLLVSAPESWCLVTWYGFVSEEGICVIALDGEKRYTGSLNNSSLSFSHFFSGVVCVFVKSCMTAVRWEECIPGSRCRMQTIWDGKWPRLDVGAATAAPSAPSQPQGRGRLGKGLCWLFRPTTANKPSLQHGWKDLRRIKAHNSNTTLGSILLL